MPIAATRRTRKRRFVVEDGEGMVGRVKGLFVMLS